MALRVTTPPASGLISLADAKAHLRVDFTDDDQLISAYIMAATGLVQANTQRRYLPQTLEWSRDRWRVPMQLPIAPGGDASNISVSSVNYADLNGDMQVLDPSQYWPRPDGDTIKIVPRRFVIWPWLGDALEPVVVEISIGEDSVPSDAAVHSTKLLVSHFYKNPDAVVGVEGRDSSTPLPLGVESLLSPDRWS